MTNIYKILNPVTDIFFISDLHYGHDRDFIYQPRGFKSLEESNMLTVKKWNDVCNSDSFVWHLGDFVFGDPKGDKIRNLFDVLNFDTLFLMPGNHTSGYRQFYERELRHKYQHLPINCDVSPLSIDISPSKTVVFIPNYFEISIGNDMVVLSHYPIASWNCQGKGSYHLSGHCHSNFPGSNKNTGFGRQLDVGVDSFGRPISWLEVKEHLKNREIKTVDHHGPVSRGPNDIEDSQYKDRSQDKPLI